MALLEHVAPKHPAPSLALRNKEQNRTSKAGHLPRDEGVHGGNAGDIDAGGDNVPLPDRTGWQPLGQVTVQTQIAERDTVWGLGDVDSPSPPQVGGAQPDPILPEMDGIALPRVHGHLGQAGPLLSCMA